MAFQLRHIICYNRPVHIDSDQERQDYSKSDQSRVIHGRSGHNDRIEQEHDNSLQPAQKVLQRESRHGRTRDNRRNEAASRQRREAKKGASPARIKRSTDARHGGLQNQQITRHNQTASVQESQTQLYESVDGIPEDRNIIEAKS